jgi:hypothetical protein
MKIFEAIKNFFNSVGHVFHDFIEQAIPEVNQEIVNQIMPTVLSVVTTLNSKDISGEQKRAQAQAQLTQTFTSVGVDLINWAIETAVQRLKQQTPQAPAAPSTSAASTS